MKNFTTLAELISYQASNFNNKTALNFHKNNQLKSFSNQEFFDKAFYFCCGLKEIGLQQNQTIAIYSYQNPIWLIADLGSILASAITIPIFHNIAIDNLIYQINDGKISYIFTDNPEILSILKTHNLNLKVISYGFVSPETIAYDYLINLGYEAVKNNKYQLKTLIENINPQDLATIIYTSGSTGNPKGVEITHTNLISQIYDSKEFFPLIGDEIVLSYLPLAHIFERMVMLYYISCGVSVYFVDDTKNIGNFLKEYRPNLMTTVPRVLEKVYAKIVNGIENGNFIKKFLGQKALKRALKKIPFSNSQSFQDKIIDKFFDVLVYKKFCQALGGKMKMIICGGAALSNDLEKFYFNIGVNVYCGYGLTEASPVIATNCPKYHKITTVGKAFPSVMVKISDDGELLAKGKNIMRQYHNLEKENIEIFDDGYLKTGDLAEIDEEGFIKLSGRKKELFKTSNGKYVNPIHIEQKLIQELGFLNGAIIIAENRQFVSTLLFPEMEVIDKFKNKFKFSGNNLEFLQSELLEKFVNQKISAINQKLNHWEQIQKFKIISEQISIESGDITPSMKLKRKVLNDKYAEIIDNFYKN